MDILEGEENDLVKKCINSWKYYNPDYKIIVLNKKNYSNYVDKNIDSIKHASDSLARYSDYIRLNVLSKYGGIWMDATIICHSPFTWIHGVQNKTNAEYIGYYIPRFTEDKYLYKSPIVETWFFACIPDSKFVKDWKDEFFNTSNYENMDKYIEDTLNEKISYQKFEKHILNYLAVYISVQKILQKSMNNLDKYNIVLFSSYGPFKYLIDHNYSDVYNAVKDLVSKDTCKKYHKYPIIKLRNNERIEFKNYDVSELNNMFSNPL